MPTLTARTLITAIGSIAYPSITIGPTGLIEDISTDASIRSESILTPTFLDIHIHGAAGHEIMNATPSQLNTIAKFLASKGTSHFLPTTVTASIDSTLKALDALATFIESPINPTQATPIGIHLEGPFLTLANLPVTVSNGRCSLTNAPETLAGSVLTLDRAVANLMAFTGCTLEQAVRCASSQPATMLGFTDTIASLRPGQPASFNQYNSDGRLEATYLNGHRINP